MQEEMNLENFGSEMSLEKQNVDSRWTWNDVCQQFWTVILGQSGSLSRTANVVHALGNVTVSVEFWLINTLVSNPL